MHSLLGSNDDVKRSHADCEHAPDVIPPNDVPRIASASATSFSATSTTGSSAHTIAPRVQHICRVPGRVRAFSLMGVLILMCVMLPTIVRPLLLLLRRLLVPRSKRMTEAPSDLAGTSIAPVQMQSLARFPTFLLRLTRLLFRRNSKTD